MMWQISRSKIQKKRGKLHCKFRCYLSCSPCLFNKSSKYAQLDHQKKNVDFSLFFTAILNIHIVLCVLFSTQFPFVSFFFIRSYQLFKCYRILHSLPGHFFRSSKLKLFDPKSVQNTVLFLLLLWYLIVASASDPWSDFKQSTEVDDV